MTTPADPAVLYPDIAAHGTLAAALQDAACGGLDGVPVTSPKGRDQVLCAQVVSVVAHRDPLDITATRGKRQWAVCGREPFQGVAMVYGTSSDLAQVAAVARGWHDGTSLDGIERAAAFACLTGRFEVPEPDPVAMAESEWRHLRWESATLEYRWQPAYQALVEAAYAEPGLRALYPFTSHWTLRFSTTTRPGMTITGPCLHIDQSGTYAVSKNLYGQGEYGRYTTPGEACVAAARRLPPGLGPVTLSST